MIGIKFVSVFTEAVSEEEVKRILQALDCGIYLSTPLLLRVERTIKIKNAECSFFILDAQHAESFEDAVWEESLSGVVMEEIRIRRQEGYWLVWVSFSFKTGKVFLSFLKKDNGYLQSV